MSTIAAESVSGNVLDSLKLVNVAPGKNPEPVKLTKEQAAAVDGLAKRAPDVYARLRVVTAQKNGLTLDTLDTLVMAKRAEMNEAAVIASSNPAPVRNDVRRREQQAENVRIQDEECDPAPPKMSLLDMQQDCVFIGEGPQVGFLSNPRRVQSLEESWPLHGRMRYNAAAAVPRRDPARHPDRDALEAQPRPRDRGYAHVPRWRWRNLPRP